MRSMKNLIFGLATIAMFFGVASCDNDGDSTPVLDELDDAASEAIVDYVNDDVDNMIIENLNQISAGGNQANLTDSFNAFRGRTGCAEVTHDEANQIITIDFGEGCISNDDIERSGKIIINYTDRRNIPGAIIVTTFEDFFVNGNQVEGIRTLTNVSDGSNTQRAFNVVIREGKITFEDGSFRTFAGTRTRVWEIEPSSEEVTLTVTGNASGITRNGTEFSKEIIEPVVFKNSCRQVGVRVAIQGIRSMTRNGGTTTIDYGDGTCDNLVEITHPDGSIEVVEIQNRRRHRRG